MNYANRRERMRRAEFFMLGKQIPEDAVDVPEVIDIVRAAAASRSGWTLIRARCAPASGRRPA